MAECGARAVNSLFTACYITDRIYVPRIVIYGLVAYLFAECLFYIWFKLKLKQLQASFVEVLLRPVRPEADVHNDEFTHYLSGRAAASVPQNIVVTVHCSTFTRRRI